MRQVEGCDTYLEVVAHFKTSLRVNTQGPDDKGRCGRMTSEEWGLMRRGDGISTSEAHQQRDKQ